MLHFGKPARLLGAVLPLALVLTVVFAGQSFAADPSISKRLVTDDDGKEYLLVTVTARGTDVYGLTITDASASIVDIKVPEGWAAIASDEKIVFRGDTPIKSGKSASFRIMTTNPDGSLGVVFRGQKELFGEKESF